MTQRTVPRKIVLGVRYDGSAYHGWQTQDNVVTVQLKLERALSEVANHPVSVVCAGRTDAGVHATGQVVHFMSDADRSLHAWTFGANSNLPPDICVTFAHFVSNDFHARFSATARRYRYIVFNHAIRPGILRHGVGWYYKPLDVARMQAACDHLMGEHDFSGFRGRGCQAKSPVRTIESITVTRQRRMVIVDVRANAFLLHMVRNLVGVLVEIGSGEKSPVWAKEVLESRDRCQGGVTIAPNGLYLVEVTYPDHFEIPRNPVGPFFLPDSQRDDV